MSERDREWAGGYHEQQRKCAQGGKLLIQRSLDNAPRMTLNRCVASFALHPSRCSMVDHGGITFAEDLCEKVTRQGMSCCLRTLDLYERQRLFKQFIVERGLARNPHTG